MDRQPRDPVDTPHEKVGKKLKTIPMGKVTYYRVTFHIPCMI